MNNILFSIIIPTYNRAGFIGKTIQSLLNQTYPNFEIIVVDDGSTDNTEGVIANINDSRLHYYRKKNAERGAARNFGAKKAKGDYINFFDSDDLAYNNHLQEAYELFLKNINPEVFVLNYEIKNPSNKLIRQSPLFKNINQQLIHGNLLSCNGVFIRKDIALAHTFSEIRELSASEDYLLWLQLASKFNFYHSNVKTSAIIEHDNRSVLTMNPEKLIIRKQFFIEELYKQGSASVFYKKYKPIILSQLNSYISLHIALIKNNKKESFKYLILSIRNYPKSVFSKRFLAIIKHLIFN